MKKTLTILGLGLLAVMTVPALIPLTLMAVGPTSALFLPLILAIIGYKVINRISQNDREAAAAQKAALSLSDEPYQPSVQPTSPTVPSLSSRSMAMSYDTMPLPAHKPRTPFTRRPAITETRPPAWTGTL